MPRHDRPTHRPVTWTMSHVRSVCITNQPRCPELPPARFPEPEPGTLNTHIVVARGGMPDRATAVRPPPARSPLADFQSPRSAPLGPRLGRPQPWRRSPPKPPCGRCVRIPRQSVSDSLRPNAEDIAAFGRSLYCWAFHIAAAVARVRTPGAHIGPRRP